MLELKNITKIYENSLNKTVLKNLNLKFNNHGLCVILGPSGSGKSTLLNLIGGLDNNYMGDILIDGISLKSFKELDSYRNHKIGFIFQNYALIEHLTSLENVMLSLKLSNKLKDRDAIKILEKVGIIDYNKKPNELSGGEQLRVGIARALVNNPDIILADEPTGALDSKNSIKIMELLKDISKNKLVIMVTHNEELANTFADRIIRINDGEITFDSGFKEELELNKTLVKKTKMPFKDAIHLSFKNLITKKGRTFIISLGASIGLTGIALILSLSNGINKYINSLEEETIYSYPITILKETVNDSLDLDLDYINHNEDKVYVNQKLDYLNKNSLIKENDLIAFNDYLEKNNINNYVNNINYSYDIKLNIYKDYELVDLNEYLKKKNINNNYIEDIFIELNQNYLKNSFKLLDGKFPENYNELVLILNENNEIYDYTLEMLGFYNKDNLEYNELLNLNLKLVLNSSFYVKEKNYWFNKSNNQDYLKKLIDESETIKIVGIVKSKYDIGIDANIGYLSDLTNYVSNKNKESLIYKEQIENQNNNIFTNTLFVNEIDSSLNDNLTEIGIITEPSKITIIPKDFKSKEKIVDLINNYDNDITYNDYFKSIINSITEIINTITKVLIIFVSISLIVSSIMIGIITYVSVLERTKEIGILRCLGARKKDIIRIFNAENLIIGSFSSLISITVTLFLNLLINKIIDSYINIHNIAILTINNILIIYFVSIFITMIGGLIPSILASKKDPIISLKSE